MPIKRRSTDMTPNLSTGGSFEGFKPSRIAAALMMALGGGHAWATPVQGAGTNNITLHTGMPTATSMTTVGTVTDITTTTVRGNTGFNSFGDFNVNAGNTVNLHVPAGKANLVNLVHDSRAVINGNLNGLKDGSIGGNIIFADPHGLVVGASGVVNVGSLTVTTPSASQMSQLAATMTNGSDAEGTALAADLMAGKYNAGNGEVSIQGKVNSAGSVNLFAASAVVGAGAQVNAGAQVFQATVNTNGLVDATAAVRQDGSILIVGKDDVTISGELRALMADGGGGGVQVNAPELNVEATGKINTRALAGSQEASGNITLQAYSDLGFSAVNADGSAIDDVDQLEAAIKQQSKANLGSAHSTAKVNIKAGAVLDAGHDQADKAGNVRVEALAVDRQLGGYAQAHSSIDIGGTLIGKDVSARSVTQVSVDSGLLGDFFDTAELQAMIDKVKLLNAGWTDERAAEHVYTLLVEAVDSSHDKGAVPPSNYSEFITLLPFATFAVAEGSSRVTVAGSANIQASGDLALTAETTRSVDTASFQLPVITSKLPFNAGIAYGRLAGETKVEILDNATIAADDMSLLAHSQDSLAVEGSASTTRDAQGSNATTLSAAFSMAHTDLTTTATVARNARLGGVAGDVSVTALTEQSLSNSASSKSIGQGAMGGPAVALALFSSNTRAQFDADLENADSLSVNAANILSEQANSAAVQAGKTSLDGLKARVLSQEDFKKFTTAIGNQVKNFLGMKITPDGDPVASKLRLASAVAVSIADHQVEAKLGGNGQRIRLNDDLSVTALQHQSSLSNGADSTVNSDAEQDDGTKIGISVAASYNQMTQHTRALVGDNATLTAGHIGVTARNVQTLNLHGLDRWNSLDEVFENLKTHAPSFIEIPSKLSTVFANSNSGGEEVGLAGSVTVLNTDIDAIAWVGDNVSLTATATGNDWQSQPYLFLDRLYDDENEEIEARKLLRNIAWNRDSAIEVSASNDIQQLAIAGNFWKTLFGNTSDGKAVGGGVNVQVSNNQASAGIGANGSVKGQRVDVSAKQNELIIGITPAAGKGASVAGTGAVVVSVVNSDVNASIHNSTRVDAGQVGISADHQLGLWSAAGALAVSSETSVGAGVAVNVLHTDVQALVGDNRGLRSSALGVGAAGNGNANWDVDELLVNAESTGQVGAFSVAGAVARTAEEQQKQDEADANSADKGLMSSVEEIGKGVLQMIFGDTSAGLQNGIAGAKGGANSIKDTIVSVPSKIGDVLDKIKGLFDDKPDPGTGKTKQSLALAGSASVNVSGQKTRAQLGDIVLDPRDPLLKGSKVTVLSLNQTNQISGSGSGALTLAGGQRSQSSAAIAGAMAYNHLYNLTQAQLKNVTLNDNDLLKVQAASAGDQVAMGLGIAVATSGNDNTSVAMSVSGGVITNTTAASVVDSTVNQRADDNQGIAVTAYDRTRTLLGGGSFSLATGSNGSAKSAGGSLVLAVQKNSLSADWLGSTATGFNRLDVSANSAARVLAGALAGAVSTGPNSNSGSGAIALVIVDNDVRAKVDKSVSRDSSLSGGEVNVNAQSVAGLSALDTLFSQAGLTALSHTDLDLDGNQTVQQIDGSIDTQDDLFADDGSTTGNTTAKSLFSGQIAGEAVLAVAGNLAVSGKNSVGGAVSVVYTGSDYSASLANTGVDLSGDLNVNAGNNTDVLAAAIGAAGGKETAVSGSVTAVVARGSVNANIDMTGKTLNADNLNVNAFKSGGAYSLAGNITGSSNNASIGGAISLSDMQQTAAAKVQNGQYILSGDTNIGAGLQSKIMTAALSGQVSGSGSAVGGAITFNRIADTTTALLNNVNMTARDLSITASQPGLGASIWSIAFNLSAAGGQAGVGGAVAVNLVDAERNASLLNSDVTLTGSADLSSSLDGEIWGIGIDAAGGSTAGVGGSIVVNVIDGEDKVQIDNSRLVTTGTDKNLKLDASAGNGLSIASLTGSVKGGGTAAVGGAISVNRIGADRIALIRNSRDISGFSHASLNSGAKQNIYAIALAGGGAGTVAVNGSFTSNVLQGTERAAIENSSLNVGALDLSAAIGDRTIWSLAGAFGGAGATAVGIADTNNIILSKRLAEVLDSDLTVDGALTLSSGGSSNIRSVAVGAGGAGTAAVGGSLAINVIEGEERAEIKNSSVEAGSLKVSASRGESDVKTLAGNAQGAGTAAVGAAIAVSTINQKRIARIVDSSLVLGSGDALVQARTDGNILTLAVAGVGGGSAGVAFSNTSNNIAAKTRAEVINSSGAAGNFEILASDTSSIHAGSGGVAGAGAAAVGVGTAINRIDSEIHASLTGNLGSGWALKNLRIDANSASDIVAGVLAGGGAGTAAVSTVAATNIIQTLTQAHIGAGAQVIAQNNIAVSARNLDSILGSAVSAAGAGNAAIAALATVNVVDTNTKAYIDGSTTSVSALAKDANDKLLVDNGALNNAPSDDHEWIQAEQFNPYPSLSVKQHQITGLAVQASSIQQVGQIALSASMAVVPLFSAAVSGVVNTTVLGGSTQGYIDGAKINQAAGAGSAQNVRVGANSHSYTAGYLAAVAGGPSAAAVGAGVDNTVISRLTQARLTGVQLNSRGATEVSAGSGQYVSTIIASIAGAIVAPGISSSLVILKGETDARVNGASQLGVGSLKVSASALQRLAPNAASVTGGAVAVSGALATLYNQSVTRAWLGADLNAATAARTRVLSGSTEVTADNSTGILMNVASAGGGGMAVGGSIGIALVETTTEAGASQVDFGRAGDPLGHLSISARDSLNVQNTVGAAVAGSNSIGGSANVLVANSATRALFDRSTLVGNQFTLSALREGDIRLNTVTGSVGTSALGGSMGLVLLGSGATSVSAGDENFNAMDELDKGGNGSLSQANSISQADKTGDLTYDAYEWNDSTQKYELVSKTDSATKNRVNSNKTDLGDRFEAGSLRKHETLARASDSSIVTSGAARISAEDKLYSRNLTGAAVAGVSAVGGAFGLTLSNARVTAELLNGSLNAASLDLSAKSGNLNAGSPAVEVHSLSGVAGFGAGLGAAVGVAVMNNQVNVGLDGAVKTSGLLKGLAEDSQSLKVQALGAAVGAGAGAGLVLGVAAHDSRVNLDVDAGAALEAGSDLDLTSTSQGAVELIGRGAAGGILAGINATVLIARDQSRANLAVGNGASLKATNLLTLSATASPRIKASSIGISLGGYVAAGASVVDALAKAAAQVSLGNNAVLTAKSADISANIDRQGTASSAEVDALGVSGGFGVSANAVVARAVNESSSLLESFGNTRFNGTGGDWDLRATTDVHQRAKTEGYAAGLLTVGAHVSEALTDTRTHALVNGVFGGDIQLLRVSATALVDNEARSQAGQGGLVSGAASIANTRDTGITRAQLLAVGSGGSAARFQNLQLSALHTSRFNAFVDSVNASLVGASGAHAKNTLTLTTESLLAAGSKIDSYGYDQSAQAKVIKAASSDYNVKSGSGGVLDAAAALSTSTISLTTLSRVGSNAQVNLIGDFRTPEHLRVSAFNDVFARDRVKLDSGGAIAIAKADSKVDVTRANATVDIESGAKLQSIGDIILSASGVYDIDTHSAGKTWGLAGAAMGDSLARVTANYQVNVRAGSNMLGYGDVKLYAGQDLAGGSNQATLVARTDLWNNTAFPVVNDPGADARYQRDARVTVDGGANVNSVGDIYAHADKGYGNLLGKGIAKDLYTEALNAIGLSVERSGGSAVNVHSAVVTVNGNLNTGYLNNRSVTVEGLSYWVNGQEMTLQQLANHTPAAGDLIEVRPVVTASDDNMSYRLVEGTYSQYISARIEQLNKQLVDYGISEIERTAMQAERNLLQQTLTKLYQEMGGTGTASLAKDQKIYIFQLDPILAKPGNVRVIGDSLVGNGKLSAPGDASIRVVNNSSAFLDIRGLEIPYHEGGQLLFNNVSLTTVGEINAANRQGSANFSLTVSATSPEPVISVINTYNPQHGVVGVDGLRAPAPDIYINGRIFNQRGEVSVTASYGSIYSNADVRGKTIAISAGRDFVLNSSTPFYHAGGDPAGSTGTTLQAPTKSTVAANNVVISAQYLNINGTIQSGAASWAATIDDSVNLANRISNGRAAYNRGGARYLQLSTTDARTGRLGYSYDFLNERLVMDSVEVSGGYMELTGHILSTGNGQLNVLDGYSQVRITNNSSYQLSLNTIDIGMETHGTLRINDVRTSGNQQYVWSTVYTRDFDAARNAYVVNKREGYSQGVLDAAMNYVATGRNAVYNPVAGRSYVWLTGQKQATTTVETYYKDKVWGLFNSGEGTLWDRKVWTDPAKVPIDGADYMGTGFYGTPGDIHSTSTTFPSGDPRVETRTWTTCEAWFLWCHEKRSWNETTSVQGEQVIHRNQVRADRPINISFIGSDTGLVNINSGRDVTLLGSILNQSGSTSITTGGQLLQNSDQVVVAARDLTLQAGYGIGNDGKGFAVQVGNTLSAASTQGDLVLRALGGGVNLSKLESGRGNISLSAQGNITAGNGVTIKGHAINLQSSHGSIGNSGSLINIDTGYSTGAMAGAAALNAGAVGGIFLNEVSGDLAVDQVIAGGDVHLRVTNGDLLDANTTLSYDTRTLAEMQALWADMGLTGPAAQAALDEQKRVLEESGQRSYERYWQMRADGLGNVQVFDESQALLGANQVAQLKVLGWSDDQIAQEQLRRVNEYSALHDRFDSANGYDASFRYQLSTAELAMLDGTAEWTPDQLQFSISSALLNRGTNTQVKLEQLNIEGNNVILEARRIGKVLDADVLVDLGAGISNLTTAQLAALAGAEHDDVYFDDINDKTKLRIVQRDDVNIAAGGNLSVTATGDVFLGGERDLNLYNVQGDTIHIKTNGNIESANGQNVVLRGSDVLLESSAGSIGGNGAVNISITGDLTARAQLLNLVAHGNLSIQRLTGLNGITLGVVGGNLTSASQMGENLLGGNIALSVDGNVGSFSDRVQLGTSGLGQQITLDIGGNAYLGGLQGAASSAGTLTFGDVSVDGLLDIGQTRDLQQNADWTVGSLVLNLANQWNMAADTNLISDNGIFARVADQATLGNISSVNSGSNVDIQARLLQANAAGRSWTAANQLTLLSHGDIGSPTWKIGVGGQNLDVSSNQGALYLRLLNGIQGGSLTSAQGQFLTSAGAVTLDTVTSQNAQVVLDGVGLVRVDGLSAQQDLDLSGENLSLGTASSALGDILMAYSGTVSADALQAAGDWQLAAAEAQIGNADVAGEVAATVTGALSLDKLTASNTVLNLGRASIGELALTGDLDLQVTGVLDLLRASVTGAAQLHHSGAAGTALRYGTLNIGDSLAVTGNGDWIGDTALVGQQISFDVGSADLGRLQSSNGALLLSAAGRFAADELHSDRQSVDLQAYSSDLGSVTAATTLAVHSTGGTLRIGSGQSGSDLSLTAEAGSFAEINFGLRADPNTPNVLVPAHLKSGRDLLVRTDGDVFGGNAEAEGLLQMFGRNLHFGRAQSLQGDVFLQTSGDPQLEQGNISALQVDAKNDVGIIASGNMDILNIAFGGAYSLKAGRDLVVGVAGDLNVSGLAEAGRDLSFKVGGDIDLQAAKAGRNVLLVSGGSVNFDEGVEAGGSVSITAAGGGISTGSGILSHGMYEGQLLAGDVLLNATGDMDIPAITAANGNIVANGHNLHLGQLTSSQDINLLANGAIRVASSQSGANQNWRAEEDIIFESLLAKGQVLFDSLLNTKGRSLRADQGAVINAGWRNGVAGNGSITLDQVLAPSLSLWAGKLIRVADANIGQRADLHAQDIELYGRHTGSGQLNLQITGSGASIADRLVSSMDANQVQISQLHVANTQFQMSGNQLDIPDAKGVENMALRTQQAVILMNNSSPAYLSAADIQLYEPDKTFSFAQNQLTSSTNAYVLHRAYTHLVLVPNFMEDRDGLGGIEYQDITAARYAEQFLSQEFTLTRLASLLNESESRTPQNGWVAEWHLQPIKTRINLDLPEQTISKEGVSKWEI